MTTLKLNREAKPSKPNNEPQNPFKDFIGQTIHIQTKGPTVLNATVTGYKNGFIELSEVSEFRRKVNDRL